ncbi:hypothetical protein V3C99_016309, partial [Haemonchus contortus]
IPYAVMTIIRYLRRRGLGIAWKAFLGCSVVFITFQIANTFPRRSHKDRQTEVRAFPEQPQVDNGGVKEEQSNIVPQRHGGSSFIAHIGGAVKEIPTHQGIGDTPKTVQGNAAGPPGSPGISQRNRKDEFYENIVVHFDLKGAPPRVSYFLDLLDIVARSGATGVLLEWEDMFPWTGQLAVAKSTDAYSLDEVQTILKKARALNLDVIPLVQTFGHLEWILKLEQFRKYRENDAYPQVICLGDEEAVAIVRDALKQVIDVHKEFGLNYFHIGADEAFEFGVCTKSQEWIASHGSGASKQLLALTHLKNISQYVKQLTSGATVLAWHDMLKDFDTRVISQLELGNVIEPVIWDYSENIVTMPDSSFAQIANNFPVVWASSAFKGANFPSAKYIDIRHYETNNRAWIDTKIAQQEKFTKFHGIIITGWQRYDHMAAICEIWPMGTPSMVLNVQIAKMGASKDYHVARDRAARVLGCREFHVGGLDLISNRCTNYSGFLVYTLFQGTAQQTISYIETELEKNHHIMGWLSPYNMRYNYTQNWYLGQVQFFVSSLHSQIKSIEISLRRELSKLFFDNTVDEFIYLTISPTIDRLQKYLDEVKRLSALRVYPKRPFRI